MQARTLWSLGVLAWLGVIALAHRAALGEAAGDTPFRWLYGGGFFVLGILLLGAVGRWWRWGSPALWRPVMLSVGSLAAALTLALLPRPPEVAALDLWMTALLGLLACAILARLLPDSVNHLWLGIDRRMHEPGA